jgi:hypothetical protein
LKLDVGPLRTGSIQDRKFFVHESNGVKEKAPIPEGGGYLASAPAARITVLFDPF